MQERLYWLGFSLFPGIGSGKFAKLIAHFGTAADAWNASSTDLLASGIGNATVESFVQTRDTFSLSGYMHQLQKANIEFLTFMDQRYPKRLAQIAKAPFLLFVRSQNEFDFNSDGMEKPVAIVGTRKVTEYGRQVTEMLTRELVESGCAIVSGLALGVDAIAHQTTLASGGITVAVLGCGVDCCYPRENQTIYNTIIARGGAIVSEYGLGIQPNKGSFPSRNRIVAGLSLGVVVTEGAVDSGSLITANDAFESDRQVFAVPGPITSSLSKGPYELIQRGAKLVTSGREIIQELGIMNQELGRQKKIVRGDTKDEQGIIDLLQEQELHFDELVRRTQMESSVVGSLLSIMEMKGIVKSLNGSIFVLAIDG